MEAYCNTEGKVNNKKPRKILIILYDKKREIIFPLLVFVKNYKWDILFAFYENNIVKYKC